MTNVTNINTIETPVINTIDFVLDHGITTKLAGNEWTLGFEKPLDGFDAGKAYTSRREAVQAVYAFMKREDVLKLAAA